MKNLLKNTLIIILLTGVLSPVISLSKENKDQKPVLQESQNQPTLLDKAGDLYQDTKAQVLGAFEDNKTRRAAFHYFGLFNFSQLDLIIPGKMGLSLGSHQNDNKSWEFEYLESSIGIPMLITDLGSMSDKRISFIKRSFLGTETFNMSYGLSYFIFDARLGNKYLNQLTGSNLIDVSLIDIQSFGFNIGIGNRWSFKNKMVFAIDWISWAQPVFITKRKTPFLDYATNEQDKKDIEDSTKLIAYIPRLTLLKLQFGILF